MATFTSEIELSQSEDNFLDRLNKAEANLHKVILNQTIDAQLLTAQDWEEMEAQIIMNGVFNENGLTVKVNLATKDFSAVEEFNFYGKKMLLAAFVDRAVREMG